MFPITKFISSNTRYSRRNAEDLVRSGRVTINGKVAMLGARVNNNDEVEIDNKLIKLTDKVYVALNKPAGYVCTTRKFPGEKNIFELLPADLRVKKLACAGRLDKESHGLVLLSNDGDWVQKISHPSGGHEKEYLVRVEFKNASLAVDDILKKLYNGIEDQCDILKVKKVEYLGDGKFVVILSYGKKRHIRRMFRAVGLNLIDLQRVRIEKIKLNNLKEGNFIFLNI